MKCEYCDYCKYPRTCDDNGGNCKCKLMKYKTIDVSVVGGDTPEWCPLNKQEKQDTAKSKPLTIEELKALQVGDWVWVIAEQYAGYFQHTGEAFFWSILDGAYLKKLYVYRDYGKTWVAYKSKEQAEAKEQCVICHKDVSDELPKVDRYGNRYCKDCYSDRCSKVLSEGEKSEIEHLLKTLYLDCMAMLEIDRAEKIAKMARESYGVEVDE